MNRLADSSSPYLRQHADNPVDWWEFEPAAFAAAAQRDVPVLLSVGYASCHWCHVMAQETFSDPDIARVMNEHFVCVKVDREQRPDVDAVYMNATVALTGQGGWPMTCFLTPTGEPFYCGTYYPPSPRGGLPSFAQLLSAITQTWGQRRGEVAQVATNVATALREQATSALPAQYPVTAELLDHAIADIVRDADEEYGGFRGAPKFPPSALLGGMLRSWERTKSPEIRSFLDRTAEKMASGGIYDQLRGGFARYSVDETWTVPHFEKMLSDNALLLRFYAHLGRVGGSQANTRRLVERITDELVDFLTGDLGLAQSALATSLDADTHLVAGQPGVEGATYVWTPEQMISALGERDGKWAAEVFGVRPQGNLDKDHSVLTLAQDPPDTARFDAVRSSLLAVREQRKQPDRDDKVITAWNAMAVTALAEAALARGRAEWLDRAVGIAEFLWRNHWCEGRVIRASRAGFAGETAGVLEDYAWFATGLLAVYQATGKARWLAAAEDIVDAAIVYFSDPEAPGSWFDTASEANELIIRPRDPLDGATPSGAAAMAEALLTASLCVSADKSPRYRELADATLTRGGAILARAPRSAGHWLAVSEAALAGPIQVAISLPDTETPSAIWDSCDLIATARTAIPGGSLLVIASPDSSPVLSQRPTIHEQPTAYVCHGPMCHLPVTTATDLREALGESPSHR